MTNNASPSSSAPVAPQQAVAVIDGRDHPSPRAGGQHPELYTLTVTQASRMTGRSTKWIYEQMKARRLPYILINQRKYVTLEALRQLLKAHTIGGTRMGR